LICHIMSLSPMVQFVVAHYNEDLAWLDPIADSAIVYTKGPTVPIEHPERTLRLPNIGREGHTYLHHIVAAYDCLPDVIVFLQGQIDDHVSLHPSELKEWASRTRPGEVTTFPWRELELFDDWDGIPWEDYPSWKKWSSMQMKPLPDDKTPAKYFKELLGFNKVPYCVGFQPGAIFAVHGETIKGHPKSFYERLLKEFFLGEMADINPETGHYMERFWLAIFRPEEYICWNQDEVSFDERNAQGQFAKGRWHRTPKGLSVDPFLSPYRSSSDSSSLNDSGSDISS